MLAEKVTIWRCNSCGSNYESIPHCKHCGAPQCPKCKATNSMMNVKVMHELAELRKPETYSEMKKKKKTTNHKPRKTSQEKIAAELKELGIGL